MVSNSQQNHVHLSVEEMSVLVDTTGPPDELWARVAACETCSALFGELIQAKLAGSTGRLEKVPKPLLKEVRGWVDSNTWWKTWKGYALLTGAAALALLWIGFGQTRGAHYAEIEAFVQSYNPDSGLWLSADITAPPQARYRSSRPETSSRLDAMEEEFNAVVVAGKRPDGDLGYWLVAGQTAANQLSLAEANISILRRAYPADQRFEILEGVILHARGDDDLALDRFSSIVDRHPENTVARANLAAVQWDVGLVQEAGDNLSRLEEELGSEDLLVRAVKTRIHVSR